MNPKLYPSFWPEISITENPIYFVAKKKIKDFFLFLKSVDSFDNTKDV